MRGLRALVVDDSSLSRRTIAAILGDSPGVSDVEVAKDGADALRSVEVDPPDFITLDLEMPQLDGFDFLQLLMDRNPLPVVVVSQRSTKEDVFRALELGAIDFVEKPMDEHGPLENLRRQLEEKVRLIQQLVPLPVRRSSIGGFELEIEVRDGPRRVTSPSVLPKSPSKVIVIGASTGGPKALVTLFKHLHDELDAAVVIAQHMPPRFTRTFAARLDRTSVMHVSEAKQFERLSRGHAYVCPGGRCIEIASSERGPALRVVGPERGVHYVPSVTQLFRSAARVLGDKAIAVVLTGMGEDGAEGLPEISKRGGLVFIEGPETAVVSGMPLAAQRSGAPYESLGIWALGDRLAELTRPNRR